MAGGTEGFFTLSPSVVEQNGLIGPRNTAPGTRSLLLHSLSIPASPLPSLALSRVLAAANHTLVKHASLSPSFPQLSSKSRGQDNSHKPDQRGWGRAWDLVGRRTQMQTVRCSVRTFSRYDDDGDGSADLQSTCSMPGMALTFSVY